MPSAEPDLGLSEDNYSYYGWRVVLAACFGVMAGFGSLFVYTFAVFVKPLGAQFGWNREAISLGFGLAAMTVGLCSPILGRLIDRFGPRRIILPCMTVFGCAVASLALLHFGLWQFYRASGICAIDFHLVSATIGNGPGFRNGGSGPRGHDPARCSTDDCESVRLESGLRFARMC